MRVLLCGATDLTLAVGRALAELSNTEVAGVVHAGPRIPISYRPEGIDNVRTADLAKWAGGLGIPERRYQDPGTISELARHTRADFGLAAGWYHLIPADARSATPQGFAGLHASLLPQLRGGAPLNWAILAGLEETGVSLFELGDGVDDGPLYARRAFPVEPRTTIGQLVRRAEDASLDLIRECLPAISDGSLRPTPQIGTPSYCLQRSPEDGTLDWHRPAAELDRLVRAVGRPYPGAATTWEGRPAIVWRAEPLKPPVTTVLGAAGQLARLPDEPDPCVVCGEGVLVLREVETPEGEDLIGALRRGANRRLGT